MKLGKKKNILKKLSTLVIVFVLIGCSSSALAITAISTSRTNSNLETIPYDSRGSPASSGAEYNLLYENFTSGVPPTAWTLDRTNPNQTWFADGTSPFTYPYCATCKRSANNSGLQDEWLITPLMNFSSIDPYDDIRLELKWYTSFHTTVYNHIIEFNVSISVNESEWVLVWSFDDMDVEFFDNWVWYNSIYNGIPIDLSDYIGEWNVKLGFQYYSNSTDDWREQEFSMDEIQVIATGGGSKLECNAGGPYQWLWDMQYYYHPHGVRFEGTVSNASIINTRTIWFFGDYKSWNATYNLYPYHFYDDDDFYTITLLVIDYSTTPPRRAINTTTLDLFLIPPTELNITVPKISLGVTASIRNDDIYDAIRSNYSINVSLGLLQRHSKTVGNGTIENIKAGTTEKIYSTKKWFFGFFRIHIIVSVNPINIPGKIQHFYGYKLGPFVVVP